MHSNATNISNISLHREAAVAKKKKRERKQKERKKTKKENVRNKSVQTSKKRVIVSSLSDVVHRLEPGNCFTELRNVQPSTPYTGARLRITPKTIPI